MKKVFYTCLVIFIISGISLFCLVDKNYDTIKEKFLKKGIYINNSEGFVVTNVNEKLELIEKEFNGNIKHLKINMNIGEIKIESYQGESIKVISKIPTEDVKNYFVKENLEELDIGAGIANEILVQIPEKLMLSADIKVGVGDVNVENLKDLKIELSTGSITGENIDNIQKIKLKIGDLILKNSKNINKIEIGTGEGDIEIVEQNNDFFIENNLGDLTIKISNDFQGSIISSLKLGDSTIENIKSKGEKYKGRIDVKVGDLYLVGKD